MGSGGPPAPGAITRDRPVSRVAGGNRCARGRGGRMPTGVTRGTLSFYLRVSPPRFPARTRAVCSFGAPRMEALQRFVGQQSFRLKDSLRRRPMPFAAGWGLSCCRHPKPSVTGGVSGCRGKRKRCCNILTLHTKSTVCINSPQSIRMGPRQPGSPRPPPNYPGMPYAPRACGMLSPLPGNACRMDNAVCYPCARGRTASRRAFSSAGSVMGGEQA